MNNQTYSTPETEHMSTDDDPIVVAALKRAGMRFDAERGWYWPFTEYVPPLYSDAIGYSESTQPYMW